MSKAKEYIKDRMKNSVSFHYRDRICANINIKNFANKAVDIAIDETKEKAIDSLSKVLLGRVDSISRYYITESFKRLLNQE